jgi:hypothetical protein
MVVPLIVTGHTSCEDKSTIIDKRGRQIDVIKNVNVCKKNNPNTEFHTIYSIDDTIYSQKYFDFFDKVLYSENIPHSYVGEKVKVETALNYVISEKSIEWCCFIKTCSRTILSNIEQYITMIGKYNHIGGNHETLVQYDTSMFIGSEKLLDVWVACEPKMNIVLNIKNEKDWLSLYDRLLLENLFWNCCKAHSVKSLLTHDLYVNSV